MFFKKFQLKVISVFVKTVEAGLANGDYFIVF